MPKLTKNTIDRLAKQARSEGRTVWATCSALDGFQARATAAGRVFYYFRASRDLDPKRKRHPLGKHGEFTCDEARAKAKRYLRALESGQDPTAARRARRDAPTIDDLAARYMAEWAAPQKKPRSVESDRQLWQNHVCPAWGSRKVADITRADVVAIHTKIGSRKHRGKRTTGAANRVLALLSKAFNLAEVWGLRPQGSNPCKHVQRFRERKVERYLSADQYRAVFGAIDKAAETGRSPRTKTACSVLRVLALTGLRVGEVTGLQWADVDEERSQLVLLDSKTGPRRVPLGPEALALVLRQPKGPAKAYVFADPQAPANPLGYDQVHHAWRRVRELAGLPEHRVHDLRHAFASAAARSGLSLPAIGSLLGHRTPATTARYLHLVDDPLQAAAAQTTATIVGTKGQPSPKRKRVRRG